MKPVSRSNKGVCIIPARAGSKRIPKKNIKLFCGKPMLQWSVETAIESGCFSKIVVSTDCAEIAEIAKQLGASVPFLRPANLSDDYTVTLDVIKHAIEQIEIEKPDLVFADTPVCCLYATAPFAQASDIRGSLERLTDARFIVPVTTFAFPIQRASWIDESGVLSFASPEHVNTRSQDLQEAVHDAGQFYWATANTWKTSVSTYEHLPIGHLLPRWRVQDIDTPEDWERAELMFAATLKKRVA